MSGTIIQYEILRNIKEKTQLGLWVNPIIDCITRSFGHEMPIDEVDDAMRGYLVIIAHDLMNKVVGYGTLEKSKVKKSEFGDINGYLPTDTVMYFGAGVVDQAYQGHGIYRELNRHRINQIVAEKAPLLTTITQNPKVEKGITFVLNEMIQAGELESFSLERRLQPQFYGRRLTADPIVTTSTPFEVLDIEAGDCFGLIFKLTYP